MVKEESKFEINLVFFRIMPVMVPYIHMMKELIHVVILLLPLNAYGRAAKHGDPHSQMHHHKL